MINFKKLFFSFFFILALKSGYSQTLQFKLYVFNPCTEKIERESFYSLQKDLMYSPKDSSSICFLPDTGTYSIVFNDENKKYHFDQLKEYSDTLKSPYILWCYEPISRPRFSGFCCCNSLCHGHQTDFYSNGNKRIDGYFKDGKPIGKLYYYYPNGIIKRIEKYNKKGDLIKKLHYDILGMSTKNK